MGLSCDAAGMPPDLTFDQVGEIASRIETLAAELPPPRPLTWLMDLAGELGCGKDSLVLDAGGRAGVWARRLEERYGCSAIVCDVATGALRDAKADGTVGVLGDVGYLPFPDATFDLVWCRDMLEMVPDPVPALAEARRVLKPGGGYVLYLPFPTEWLEAVERSELFAALPAPAWWDTDVESMRDLIAAAGFEIVAESRTSPEHTQDAIESRSRVLDSWAALARLERAPAEFTAAIGPEWYERLRAWNRWSIYLLLGKLASYAWALRKPAEATALGTRRARGGLRPAAPDTTFDRIAAITPRVQEVTAELPAPRAADWLLSLAGDLGCGQGSVVLDAGGWSGYWARALEARYGCRATVCDVAPTALAEAVRAGTPPVAADVGSMPFCDEAFDFVWCRDVLSMLDDPQAFLDETMRVLEPGGGLMLYSAFPTERLEPRERAELFAALGAPSWWDLGAGHIRRLIQRTGFRVVTESRTSPEFTQAGIEAHNDLLDDWVSLARLERAPERFRAEVGDAWFRRWKAWNRWSIYLLLGKLETIAWAMRKPA